MKIVIRANRYAGMTLIELFIVLVVIGILMAMMLPALKRPKHHGPTCTNNLKQIGLAYHIWEADHGDKYPTAVSEKDGGTMEFATGPNAFRHYQVMSNELSTPRILICPYETDAKRFIATNWNISNSNISFFVGVDAVEENPKMILGGDYNITNGTPIRNGILELTTNRPSGWTREVHNKVGNLLMADGSSQQVSIIGLRGYVTNTGVATNRLQMPVLGP